MSTKERELKTYKVYAISKIIKLAEVTASCRIEAERIAEGNYHSHDWKDAGDLDTEFLVETECENAAEGN